ncbi:MAG: hypothetical protein KC656_06480 [Myxococcales bacterium]|nr:hypothetical protein [Myxococcales bacterium]
MGLIQERASSQAHEQEQQVEEERQPDLENSVVQAEMAADGAPADALPSTPSPIDLPVPSIPGGGAVTPVGDGYRIETERGSGTFLATSTEDSWAIGTSVTGKLPDNGGPSRSVGASFQMAAVDDRAVATRADGASDGVFGEAAAMFGGAEIDVYGLQDAFKIGGGVSGSYGPASLGVSYSRSTGSSSMYFNANDQRDASDPEAYMAEMREAYESRVAGVDGLQDVYWRGMEAGEGYIFEQSAESEFGANVGLGPLGVSGKIGDRDYNRTIMAAQGDGVFDFDVLSADTSRMEGGVNFSMVELYGAHEDRAVQRAQFSIDTEAEGGAEAMERFTQTGLLPGADQLADPEDAAAYEALAQQLQAAEQLELARQVPIATALTAEADSGGHTDHRALPVILPQMLALRDALARPGFPVFVGAAGGLGTPTSIWGAFAMGADYVLTGSVNQATREAGTSEEVKRMLGEAGSADVASGPAPDMFEIGAKVQVLSRGSMYAQRAQRLYDLYKSVGDLDALPEAERSRLEKQIFQRPLDEVWEETRAYWEQRDPQQVKKALERPNHRMALTFRWYLGMTSRWARMGDPARKRDYQIWCGPSMGAFNEWIPDDHPMEYVVNRTVVGVAELLMRGAAEKARAARLPR